MAVAPRIIGLDHGILHTGYGILSKEQLKINCLGWGTIDTSPNWDFPQRLQKIYQELLTVISRWQPQEMACLLYTSPSPRDGLLSRMPSSA